MFFYVVIIHRIIMISKRSVNSNTTDPELEEGGNFWGYGGRASTGVHGQSPGLVMGSEG